MVVKTAKTFGPCTLNNYEQRDIDWLNNLECTKLTCSKEVGESGTPHLQFNITFRRTYSLAALKKLHQRVHWEFQYCAQDNNYIRKIDSEIIIDKDERKKRGERSDLHIARSIVKETGSMRAVTQEVASVQAIRSSEIWLRYNEPERPVEPITVKWFWGESESGKTRAVYEECENEHPFRPVSYKWWEGYDGQRAVLLDDLRGDFCKFHELLTLLDIYPVRVECKGGSRQLRATTIYITSCFSPESLYSTREDIYQLQRRITEVREFRKVDQ